MESIERAIQKLEWQNDIDSETQRTIALLEAFNEIAEQLANINQVLNNRP